MGHDNVASISPAKWRTTNPQSPSLGAFRKSGIYIRDDPFDRPDLGWKALLKRHRFLLFMLAILTFLCTIYLYFAITFASVDSCRNLQGTSRAQCYKLQKKTGQVHGHGRRRALLLDPRVISTYDVAQEEPLDVCGQQYANYYPCRDVSVFEGACRQRHERPPLCKIPTPLGYQRPGAWHRNTEDTSRVLQHTDVSGAALEKDEGLSEKSSIKARVYAELNALLGEGTHRIVTVGCQACKAVSSAFTQERDTSTLSVLGVNSSGLSIQSTLDKGFPALLLTLLDEERFPAHSFDLISSDGCEDTWNLEGDEYAFEVTRFVRPGGYYIGSCVGSSVEKWTEEFKRWNWGLVMRFADYYVWKKNEPDGVGGLVGFEVSRINNPTKSSLQGGSTLQYNQNLAEAGASVLRAGGTLQSLYEPSSSIWRPRVARYSEQLGKHMMGQVRNVLDMNAGLGSFAAALMEYHPVWVMNVVPKSDQQGLEALYSRGLLGVQHDWSEAFPTPPRSYDFVHSSWMFSDSKRGRALEMIDVILEVDRILRPGGLAIIRDAVTTANQIKRLASYVRWRVLFERFEETDQTEYVLIMRKESDLR